MFDYFEMKGFELEKEHFTVLLQEKKLELFTKKTSTSLILFRMKKVKFQVKKRTYIKTFPSGKVVQINILIADTDADAHKTRKSLLFKKALKDSLMNADLIEYEGHSGLGENLNLKEMYGSKQLFDPKKSQVIFINGCHSYTYYKNMFFEGKGNEENLDLILSGTTTLSDDGPNNAKAFLKYFLNPDSSRKVSFQAILKNIEESNAEGNGTYLTSIYGDVLEG